MPGYTQQIKNPTPPQSLSVSRDRPIWHVYTYTHTYIPWTRKCVVKTVECGTSYKYTKYTNLQCKVLQKFNKNIINHLYAQKIHLHSKSSVYVGIFFRLL